jgi:hypothetical protein
VTVAMKNKKRNEEQAKQPQAQIEITNSILNEMSKRKKKNVIVYGLPASNAPSRKLSDTNRRANRISTHLS